MAEITLDREILLYISNIEGVLFPENDLYPDDDLYPGFGTLIIESGETGSGIVAGSLHIDEVIADSGIMFGQCIANKFECQLYNIPYDIANKEIIVVAKENGTQVPMFKGIIDSSVKDSRDTERTIVAYDNFYYKRDVNVASWWNGFWATHETSTLKDIRDSLLEHIGIPFYEKNLVNDSVVINKMDNYSVLSFADCLKAICELQGCFPNIDRTGTLEFVVLGEDEIDITDEFEENNAKFEDYTTAKITGIKVFSDTTEIAYSVGTVDNMYPVTGNLFLSVMSASAVNSCITTLLNAIKDIEYTPCTIPMILSDLEVELGNKVVYADGKSTYVLQNTYSGSVIVNQSIVANATSEYQSTVPDSVSADKSLGRKISKVEHDLDGFRVEVGDELDQTSSKLNVMSGQISAKVDNGDYTASVIIGKINDDTPSGVQIDADKINLNGYVTVTDLKTSGQTIINGSNITTGKISASVVDTDNLVVKNGDFTKSFSVSVPTTTGSTFDISADSKGGTISHSKSGWGSSYALFGLSTITLSATSEVIVQDALRVIGDTIVAATGASGVYVECTNGEKVSLHATPSNTNHGLYSNSRSKWIAYMNSSGTTLTTTSDKRAKIDKGVLDSQEAIDILKNMNIVKFVMKDDVDENNLEQCGLYAQELRDFLIANDYLNRGYIVLQNDDSSTSYDITKEETDSFEYAIDYSKFIPTLIKGWQEQQKEIDELKNELAELKSMIKNQL